MEEEEKETRGTELPDPDNSRLASNNNEVPVEESKGEVDEDSEVEYNFPDLDREEMYLKARPHGLEKRRRGPRSILKLKSPRNAIRVV